MSTRSVTPIWNEVTVSTRVLVAAVGADDPERHAVRQADLIEALAGRVEHAEAVEVPLHVHVRPDLAVDDIGVAVDDQHPVRIDVGVRAQRAGRLILRLRIEHAAVGAERAILHDERISNSPSGSTVVGVIATPRMLSTRYVPVALVGTLTVTRRLKSSHELPTAVRDVRRHREVERVEPSGRPAGQLDLRQERGVDALAGAVRVHLDRAEEERVRLLRGQEEVER